MSTPNGIGEIRMIRLDQIDILNPRERGSRVGVDPVTPDTASH